jgi:hypothetical protein
LWDVEAPTLDNRLTDGREVASLTCFTSQEDSWYSFLLEAGSIPGQKSARRIRSLKNPMTSSGFEPATFRFVT